MRSSLFLSIAVLVVRVTRILAVAESDGEGLFPDLDPTYVAMDQPFVPPADLQSIPSDSDMWDTEEESDLGNLYLSSFDLNPGSFDLASSEPYIGPDLETGDLDDYKSDPLAKCPIETYTKAACCATVLSDNRYIPNCSPSKKFLAPGLSIISC